MSTPAVVVHRDATLMEAARLMVERRVGGLPVVDDDGLLVGFITDSDFAAKERGVPFSFITAPQVLGQWLGHDGIERIYERARTMCVRDVMSSPAITVTEDESLNGIVRKMTRRDVNRLVVERDRVPVGVVARHDLLRLLLPPEERESAHSSASMPARPS